MSESSFPFKGQAVADGPAPDVTEAQSNKTVLALAAGLAGVVVLAVVVYLLFFSGGDDSATAKAPKAPAAGAVEAAPEAVAPVAKQRISAKSFGRDPFEAQIVAVDTAVVAPVVPSAGGSVVTTTPDTGTSGSTPGTTTPDTTTTVPSDTVPSPSARHTFQVVAASADNMRVTVKVDGKTYKNLRAGEVFATIFKVRVVGGEVNQFQVGDERFRVQGAESITVAG